VLHRLLLLPLLLLHLLLLHHAHEHAHHLLLRAGRSAWRAAPPHGDASVVVVVVVVVVHGARPLRDHVGPPLKPRLALRAALRPRGRADQLELRHVRRGARRARLAYQAGVPHLHGLPEADSAPRAHGRVGL